MTYFINFFLVVKSFTYMLFDYRDTLPSIQISTLFIPAGLKPAWTNAFPNRSLVSLAALSFSSIVFPLIIISLKFSLVLVQELLISRLIIILVLLRAMVDAPMLSKKLSNDMGSQRAVPDWKMVRVISILSLKH